jgi:SIR2-like protein
MSGGLEVGNPGVEVPGNHSAVTVLPVGKIEPPWPVLAQRFRTGQLIPFLGAGASAYCRDQAGGAPPSVTDLIEKLANNAQLTLHCDNPGCQQFKFDLARLASYYQTCVTVRTDLDEFLQSEIAKPTFSPNPLHHLLARIARDKPMLIITTNYDDLLEKAFDDPADGAGPVPYEVLVTPVDDLAYEAASNDETGPEHAGGIWHRQAGGQQLDFARVPDTDLNLDIGRRSVIYKIHGSVPRGKSWRGGYLIAEEDYARFLGRMDRQGIVPGAIVSHIVKKTKTGAGAVRNYSLLFLGYGMRDWNLRVLLEELHVGRRAPNEEKHYAFVLGPDQIEESLFRNRRVEVYDCHLARFVENIVARLP